MSQNHDATDQKLAELFGAARMPPASLGKIRARLEAERAATGPARGPRPPRPGGLARALVKNLTGVALGAAGLLGAITQGWVPGFRAEPSRETSRPSPADRPWFSDPAPAPAVPPGPPAGAARLSPGLRDLAAGLTRLAAAPDDALDARDVPALVARSADLPVVAGPWAMPYGINYDFPRGGREAALAAPGSPPGASDLRGWHFRFRQGPAIHRTGRPTPAVCTDVFQLAAVTDAGRRMLGDLDPAPVQPRIPLGVGRSIRFFRRHGVLYASLSASLLTRDPRLEVRDRPGPRRPRVGPNPRTLTRLLGAGAPRAAPAGQEVVPPGFDEVRGFVGGVAAVRAGDRWGAVASDGTVVLSPRFTQVWDATCGRILTRDSAGFAFFDTRGRPLGHQPLNAARPFREGLAAVKIAGNWTYLDLLGRRVIYPKFDEVRDFSEGKAFARREGDWYLLRDTMPVTAYPEGPPVAGVPAGRFVSGLAPAMAGEPGPKRYGYLDDTGRFRIAPRFSEAAEFEGDYARVMVGSEARTIDRRGSLVEGDPLAEAAGYREATASWPPRGDPDLEPLTAREVRSW